MSEFKISPDLFLAEIELDYQRDCLDSNGFRKNILDNSVSFGLIKSLADSGFANGRVTRDVDTTGGDKTIKIAPVAGVDNQGRFIYSPSTINQITVPNDGNWHWLKVSYATSVIEEGTVTIAVDGTLTGTGTKFLSTLRGGYFPMTIKFVNSALNFLEYQILDVTSDTSASLSNPAANIGGYAEFASESGLQYSLVGTFTAGVDIPADNKYPFIKDSMSYELVVETVSNTKPTYIQGQEFFISRVKVSGSDLITQDRREEYWETKASALIQDISRLSNPLAGVESVKWQVKTSPADKNLVQVGWGFRSSNWSIDTSQNILTLLSGQGGKYIATTNFTDGDFNRFKVYTSDGRYAYVINSVKAGTSINLTLDTLLVNSYSSDGGTTMTAQEIVVVPNAELVEFWCQSEPTDNVPSVNAKVTFPINDPYGVIELEQYKDIDSPVYYNIKYRYHSHKEATGWTTIPSSTIGYLVETAFDADGNLTGTTRYPYVADDTDGFIKLNMCPWAYKQFQDEVFNQDLLGVNEIETLSATTTYTLTVGSDKHYQLVKGTQSIGSDTIFFLSTALPCRDGSTFKIHFDCDALTLGGNVIYIKQGSTTLKQITQGDVYQMLNQDKGIIFSFVYDATEGKWVGSQNYDLGKPGEIVTIDGVISSLFDTASGTNNAKGKVKGLFGYSLCNHAGTIDGMTVPNLSYRFLLGQGNDGTHTAAPGDIGGSMDITLIEGQLPAHSHSASQGEHTHSTQDHTHGLSTLFHSAAQNGVDGHRINVDGVGSPVSQNTDAANVTVNNASAGAITIGNTGSGDEISIVNQYYAVIYAKKLF
jgi:microcystin-dependent protein